MHPPSGHFCYLRLRKTLCVLLHEFIIKILPLRLASINEPFEKACKVLLRWWQGAEYGILMKQEHEPSLDIRAQTAGRRTALLKSLKEMLDNLSQKFG